MALAVLAGAAAGCSSGARATPRITTTARAGVAPVPPAKGAFFGVWTPDQPLTGADAAEPDRKGDLPPLTRVKEIEKGLGRQLDIAPAYHSWTARFPDEADKAVLASTRYLMVTWASADTREIVNGRYDALVRERARALKATGKPIFLRWARDMDKESLAARIHSGADYVAAWKHLRAIFAAERVANVVWVWCPTASAFQGPTPASYPGDDQVDWVCTDAQPGGNYDYRDLVDTIGPFQRWAAGHPKPVMIAEFGVPRSYGTRRAEWLRKAAQTLQDPQVKAVVYFNSDEQAQDPRDDRRGYALTADPHALSALRELATTPYFNPRNLPVTSGG
ncbi:hypothetical protein K1Y72_04595 [Actinomadura sp. PM05-2]|uniref:GH26 domain-containing protein n=1 Tax=Actinomadura parmotrematis TaxID=2864039 RepID=A0ABS7FMN0_9ACTN|nr:hypothetical protein [Actinomadura parmotrematis]